MSNGTRTRENTKTSYAHARDVLLGIDVRVVPVAAPVLIDLFPELAGRVEAGRGVLVEAPGAAETVFLLSDENTATAAEVLDNAWAPVVDPAERPWISGPNGVRYLPL